MEGDIMDDKLTIEARGLGIKYYKHKIFQFLEDLYYFYGFIATNSCDTADGLMITGKFSVGYHIYSSIQGTIESIKILIYAGRLNDVFALSRKYDDAILTALYITKLIKQDERKIIETEEDLNSILTNSLVREWSNKGKPLYWKCDKPKDEIKKIDKYIWELLGLQNNDPSSCKGKEKNQRQKCNDNVHYNSLSVFTNNDYETLQQNNKGLVLLNQLYDVLMQSFAMHFSYLYIMKPYIYASNEYISSLEDGIQPEEGSERWVTSIVQDVFDKYIKAEYKEAANYLIKMDLMELK